MGEDRLAEQKQCEEQSRILRASVKAGLAHMASTFGKDVDMSTFSSWISALSDLTLQEVEEGFSRVERTFIPTSACPFPVPAHLRIHIDTSRKNQTHVQAESAWEKSLAWVRRYYRPDCRNMDYPNLGEQLWRSLGAAGGPDHVSDCSTENLAWAKKRFIEAYLSLENLKQDANFIGNVEAKQILSGLTREFELKKLQENQ